VTPNDADTISGMQPPRLVDVNATFNKLGVATSGTTTRMTKGDDRVDG